MEIKKWVRNADNQKVGCLIAWRDGEENKVFIGYSFCDIRYDIFHPFIAVDKAIDKAHYLSYAKNLDKIYDKIPYKHKQDFLAFLSRCLCYFRDENIIFPDWFKNVMVSNK